MASSTPRVQVTVDSELSEAMAAVEAHPKSKSKLIRDLALRGAEAVEEERRRHDETAEFLLRVASGEVGYDFEVAEEIVRERHEMPRGRPPG